jgi:hypothetical protein
MFYDNAYKNWGTAQRLICHYDLFSQNLRLKKAKGKQIFFFLMQFWELLMKACVCFIAAGNINFP